jgi:phosphate/sulfate permease
MSQGEKICVHCGQSCDGQPRVKDAHGNYAHTACAEQQKKAQASGGKRGSSKPKVEAGSMAAILADIDEADMIGGEHSCQSCGYPIKDDVLVCLHCGFNRETGRQFSTKVGRDPNHPTASGKALNVGAGVGSFALKPFLPIVGAIVGGVIGAFIWGIVAYYTGYEVGYLAILVGALCGLGATACGEPETTGGGMLGGIMAAAVAIASIGAGKYFALDMMYRKYMRNMEADEHLASFYEVDESTARSMFAREKGGELLNGGFEVSWENPDVFLEAAWWPDDYPEDFQKLITDKWDSMTAGEQYAWKTHVAEEFAKEIEDEFSADDIDNEWAIDELAQTTAQTLRDNGQAIEWPDKSLPLDMLMWPDEYPDALALEIDSEWGALGESGQLDYLRQAEQEMAEMRDTAVEFAEESAEEFKKTAVIESFKSPIQALFLLLAIGTAYGIPANND